ncbi:hypothetical protein [Sandaracinus amylolyticus]|uniref:Putative glycoside hydrolase n=1 Tax=Sandaracinus amylolyticus TaxID=927083 RepID=A0A0F6W8J8_9BACT|nr:hypothetical protein [Sandaracinus amylolyticus]AKF10058.1 Putative glycoside hydrolase [Sandaracinus amylolyticus]
MRLPRRIDPQTFATRALLLLAMSAPLAACGDDDDGAPTIDASTDGGHDASTGTDAGATDSGASDAGSPDSGSFDAGTDAGMPDAGPPDSGVHDPAPPFRNPVALPDAELATEALRILGAPQAGGSGSCASCHSMTRARIREWQAMTDFAWGACFTDLEVRTVASARAVVDCLREGAATDEYEADAVGVLAGAARLDWYPFVFERALGPGWEASYDAFVAQAGMPIEPATHTPFTQAEFDVVAEWFLRGVPNVEAVLPQDPPPDVCRPSATPAVAAHVAEMTATGWGAINRDNGLLMHGCAGAASPRDCFATAPRVTAWEVAGAGSLRWLYAYSSRSSFWTRSSADGRFVAHGGGDGGRSTFIDLQENRVIGANASYDPSFFPDNSGFVFQGGGAHFCEQSVLTTGSPTTITFNEPQCETNGVVGLYEHVGASLGGGDYWAVHGDFTSDNGHGPDPWASFSVSTTTSFTRLVNDGSGFAARETIDVSTPYEGDAVISPSSRLVVTRVGSGGQQHGFVLRRVDARRSPDGSWSATAPVIGRYCINGGKPAISFDERWMVLHHYEADRADAWLVDLVTGQTTRITNMSAGYYALFPHFRSDGWIYIVVRGEGREQVVASDAALVLAP